MNFKTKVIVGSQWGDEGKGKITDYFAQKADIVVRYQGGNNAGHTIKFSNKKFALNHVPSGVFNSKTINVLAQGMVINPLELMKEITYLQENQINVSNIVISDKAHVILPYHIDIDQAVEELKKKSVFKNAIGTTKKGIGPCYEDKIARIGIRFSDFIDANLFQEQLEKALIVKNVFLKALKIKPYTSLQIMKMYEKARTFLKPFVKETSALIEKMAKQQKDIVFESAQGSMLCLENGSYPYVTSSSPNASSIFLNIGVNTFSIKRIIGIVKAYTTRVGNGALPSEIQNIQIKKHIQNKGNEFGTVTQRARRIGWLDLVVLKHSIRVSGFNELIITLLDVLDELETIKIVYAYELNGKVIDYIPSSQIDFEKCKPKFINIEGWKQDISKVKKWEELPIQAQKYLKKIEELLKVKITYFSVGPDRKQTVKIEK